jgi:hypothetical protein
VAREEGPRRLIRATDGLDLRWWWGHGGIGRKERWGRARREGSGGRFVPGFCPARRNY